MSDGNLPSSLQDLTPQWLTQALAESFPGISVIEAKMIGVLHGSAAKARLELTSIGADEAPSSLLVKGSFTEAPATTRSPRPGTPSWSCSTRPRCASTTTTRR